MEMLSISLNDGRSVKLTLPEAQGGCSSVYAFGVHRSGSTLLNDILALGAAHARHVYYSLSNDYFDQGIDNDALRNVGLTPASQFAVNALFERDGYIFGGFRGLLPLHTLYGLSCRKKILLVRDPRDAIVSHYFSILYSHAAPAGTDVARLRSQSRDMTIIDFVLNSEIQEKLLSSYAAYDLLPHNNLLVIRYEDYIFDKLKLVSTVLGHLGIEVPEQRQVEIAKTVDLMPDKEQVYQHVRHARPGDHVVKLPAGVIDVLTAKFDRILSKYTYI
jgi:hypothetical protein